VLKLVGNKRLALWKEILRDYNYPDTSLIDDIANGFKLSGWMPRSNVVKTRTKRPSMSMDTLKDLSKALNATAYKKMMVRQEPDIETATWSETEEEVNKGWVWFDGTEVSEGLKFVGKRFGIRQSNFLPVFALLLLACFLVCFLAGTASGLRTGPLPALLWLSTS